MPEALNVVVFATSARKKRRKDIVLISLKIPTIGPMKKSAND